jgi:hypothetical protein
LEFTKTRDVPGSLQKTGDIPETDFLPGHESESGDCPQETGTSGNPSLIKHHIMKAYGGKEI